MTNHLNGIDVSALQNFSKSVATSPLAGKVSFNVKTNWQYQTRTIATINHFTLGGAKHDRHFEVVADEPPELLGANTAPNPQELLMAALNACLSVGYVANASVMGIKIHSLEIETEGSLDLRGFLGLDAEIDPGYDEVSYTVRISTDADETKVQELHNIVTKTSVNLANFSKSIRMNSKLEVSKL
ncbi:OsmC family protein [Pseudomonas rhodesiae]|uniref:OsmC family protein n=1 Tax=Pseudomonas rhodesiae TaxID=76760 RepID=UPI0028A95FF4|nr:OsmC family protein [Pseudomonas rhodesiae]